MRKPKNSSAADIEPGMASPSAFARGVLGMKLYQKQAAVLDALWPVGSSVSFRSCNEGGKTKRVITAAILWHLSMFPKGTVISTSGSFRQITDQLLPGLRLYSSRFPKWKFHETPRISTEHPNCFWNGFATSEAGRFEGYHQEGDRHDPDAPLMIIVDEAKTVKDPIFEAIERCKPTRVLLASSPGYAEGEFYRSHTTRSAFYKTFVQRAIDCPHITAEEIERVRAKWGPDHPLVKSMVDAEFMAFVANAIVDLKALEDLMADPPDKRPGERHAFCDFAWGGDGDENVMALREGNVVTIPLTFRAGELHAICGRFVQTFTKLGLRPEEISGDEGGAGKMIIDELADMGWPVGRVNNGSAPRFDDHYQNAAAEMWYEGAKKIVRREVVLTDDNDMKAQMLNRKKVFHSGGKLAIESKKDMKKANREGGPAESPDRADAVFGALMPPLALRVAHVMGTHSSGALPGNKTTDFSEWGQSTPSEEQPLPGVHIG